MKIIFPALLLFASSHCYAADTAKPTPPTKTLSSENGRFVFGQISEYRRDQYLIDTKTGRLWRVVTFKYKNEDGSDLPGDGYEVMQPVLFKDTKGVMTLEPDPSKSEK